MLGFALAVLFKGAPLAIELGLAWALAVENKIVALLIESDAYERFRRFTLGEHSSGATGYFGPPVPEGSGRQRRSSSPGAPQSRSPSTSPFSSCSPRSFSGSGT